MLLSRIGSRLRNTRKSPENPSRADPLDALDLRRLTDDDLKHLVIRIASEMEDRRATGTDRCVCCGKPIPEGRHVCICCLGE